MFFFEQLGYGVCVCVDVCVAVCLFGVIAIPILTRFLLAPVLEYSTLKIFKSEYLLEQNILGRARMEMCICPHYETRYPARNAAVDR